MVKDSANGSGGSRGTIVDEVKLYPHQKAAMERIQHELNSKRTVNLQKQIPDTAMSEAFAAALKKLGKKNKVTRVHDSIIIEMKEDKCRQNPKN